MCDLQDLANAFDRLIKPRPQSVEEIAERLRTYNHKLVRCCEVPFYKDKGWSAACYFGQMGDGVYLLMQRGAS